MPLKLVAYDWQLLIREADELPRNLTISTSARSFAGQLKMPPSVEHSAFTSLNLFASRPHSTSAVRIRRTLGHQDESASG